MGRALDLTGVTFGRLTVDEFAGTIGDNRKNSKRYWYCTCECGAEVLVHTGDLRSGKTKSCGCLNKELARERKLVHGGCLDRRNRGQSAEFTTWQNMRNRDVAYPIEWDDFKNFFRDLGWKPGDTYQLSRHDINQPHGLTNTHWRDPNVEQQERRSRDIADEFCLDMSTVDDTDAFTRAADGAREEEAAGVYQ